MHHPRRAAAAALTALALTSLAACGEDTSAAPAAATRTADDGSTFNDADVAFATDMIPHHAQAVQMVVLTQGRTLDPAVQDVADQIRDAQVPEVETMTDWLVSWDEPVPETSLDHVNAGHDADGMDEEMDEEMDDGGHGGDHSDMNGMMSESEMSELAAASDTEFATLFLTMMVEHHEGAVTMAQTEIADGTNADAIALAEDIVDSQTAEIATMEELLAAS